MVCDSPYLSLTMDLLLPGLPESHLDRLLRCWSWAGSASTCAESRELDFLWWLGREVRVWLLVGTRSGDSESDGREPDLVAYRYKIL